MASLCGKPAGALRWAPKAPASGVRPAGSSPQGPARGTSRFRFAVPALPLPRASCLCGRGGWVFTVERPVCHLSMGACREPGSGGGELGLCPCGPAALLPPPPGRVCMTQDPDGTPGVCWDRGQSNRQPAFPSGLDTDSKNEMGLLKGE